MLMSTILSRVTAPLHRFTERHIDNGDLAYALRAAQVDTAWRAFSFDPTLAGPRGESPEPSPLRGEGGEHSERVGVRGAL